MTSNGQSHEAAADTSPDLVVADKYKLKRMLGRGGMGSVWLAHHLSLDVDVVIKFLNREMTNSPNLRARFAQEAMSAAQIRSPYVVGILDYGIDERGRPYIAMERLSGMNLAQFIELQGRLSLGAAVRLTRQTCKGLSKAHSVGIVHRDMKPENLFLCDDEDEDGFVVKILDFGIAKTASAPTLAQTAEGTVMGTPLYMSPEQALGEKVDARTDVYSFGLVLYECLSGRPVVQCDNAVQLAKAIVEETPPPISRVRPELPVDLDAFFDRALAKDRQLRFEDTKTLSKAFLNICRAQTKGASDVEPAMMIHVECENAVNVEAGSSGNVVDAEGATQGPPMDADATADRRTTNGSPNQGRSNMRTRGARAPQGKEAFFRRSALQQASRPSGVPAVPDVEGGSPPLRRRRDAHGAVVRAPVPIKPLALASFPVGRYALVGLSAAVAVLLLAWLFLFVLTGAP